MDWLKKKGKGKYTVDLEKPYCSCPDFELRGHKCKHIDAKVVELAQDGSLDEDWLRSNADFLLGCIAAQFLPLPAHAERTFF